MSKQINTREVTYSYVMGSSAFKKGMEDYLRGVWEDSELRATKRYSIVDQQWNYERGRIFCLYLLKEGLTNLKIKDGKRVTYEAKVAYTNAHRQGYFC